MKMSGVLTQSKDVLQALPVLKVHFLYRSKIAQSHIRCLKDELHTCHKSHLQMNYSTYKKTNYCTTRCQ